MSRPKTQNLRRIVKLKSGGTITLSVPINILGTVTPTDRAFILDVVDCMEEYDKKNSADCRTSGRWIAE